MLPSNVKASSRSSTVVPFRVPATTKLSGDCASHLSFDLDVLYKGVDMGEARRCPQSSESALSNDPHTPRLATESNFADTT